MSILLASIGLICAYFALNLIIRSRLILANEEQKKKFGQNLTQLPLTFIPVSIVFIVIGLGNPPLLQTYITVGLNLAFYSISAYFMGKPLSEPNSSHLKLAKFTGALGHLAKWTSFILIVLALTLLVWPIRGSIAAWVWILSILALLATVLFLMVNIKKIFSKLRRFPKIQTSGILKTFQYIRSECINEYSVVNKSPSPGFIVNWLRYLFTSFFLVSISKWISGTKKAEDMIFRRDLRPYKWIEIYVIIWLCLETVTLITIEILVRTNIVSSVSSIINTALFSKLKILVLLIFSYRLFDIFQSWVGQFILGGKWKPISINRSLVLAFEGFVEIVLLGTLLGISGGYYPRVGDGIETSLMTMLINPEPGLNIIQYVQLLFAVLFIGVVVQHIIGRLSTNQFDNDD
jgi:hypothetical protein